MKKLILILCIVALSGVTAAPLFAQIVPGRASVSPFIGWYSFDDGLNLKDKPVLGVRLGYDITGRWGAEGAFDYVRTKSKINSEITHAYGVSIGCLISFPVYGKTGPLSCRRLWREHDRLSHEHP